MLSKQRHGSRIEIYLFALLFVLQAVYLFSGNRAVLMAFILMAAISLAVICHQIWQRRNNQKYIRASDADNRDLSG